MECTDGINLHYKKELEKIWATLHQPAKDNNNLYEQFV